MTFLPSLSLLPVVTILLTFSVSEIYGSHLPSCRKQGKMTCYLNMLLVNGLRTKPIMSIMDGRTM